MAENRELILETIETLLELQLRAVRQLRGTEEMPPPVRLKRGLRKNSLVSLTIQVLEDHGKPLHINEIVRQLTQNYSRVTDKDALSGALSRPAKEEDKIKKCGRNIFGLVGRD